MGRNAGLNLERIFLSVDLHEGDRIVPADQMLHVLCLRSNLEAVVAVEIKSAGRTAGVVYARIHVLLRHENEKDIVQKICHVDRGLL